MSWVAVAVGLGSATAGVVGANQTRQRQKGIIGKGYELGQQRLNLSQLDTRQRVAEQSGARGLDQGGDVTTGPAVGPGPTPSVGGAHTLGAQQTSDLAREQTLEQESMLSEKNAELSNANETANQSMIGAVTGGIGAAVNTKSALDAYSASKRMASSPYPNSFGGIDPVNPLGRGTWASDSPAAGSTGSASGASSVANFNVNG